MKFSLAVFALLLSITNLCSANEIADIFGKSSARVVKVFVPVSKTDGMPAYWNNYGSGISDFTPELSREVLGARTPNEFVAAIIEANKFNRDRSELVTVNRLKIPGGFIYSAQNYYYVTVDESGKLVSFLVEGQEKGVYPAGTTGLHKSDDLLCFFQGARKGTCATGDESD